MFQWMIKQYGLQGNGAGPTGSVPYQLILRVVGVSEASPKNVWMKDYDTILDAKVGAIAIFASTSPVNYSAAGTGGTNGAYWTDSGMATTGTVESLSQTFTAF